ncbi:MAG: AraC family transcriptional regulator [Chromatiales bacterium]|nr:AraC family transcriptional regulator [Chromatiales bacterium]
MLEDQTITLFSAVLLLGAVQGAFLIFLVLGLRRGNRPANLFLASLLLLFVVDLLDEFSLTTGYYLNFPLLVAVNLALDFLLGPAIYLYTRAMTRQEASSRKDRLWPHFIPFGIALIIALTLVFQFTPDEFRQHIYAEEGPLGLDLASALMTIGGLISIGYYLIASLRLLVQHRRLIQNRFSYLERISLSWLRNLLLVLASLYFVYLSAIGIDLWLDRTDQWEDRLLYVAIVGAIYLIGIFGIRQPTVFRYRGQSKNGTDVARQDEVLRLVESDESADIEEEKYRKSALSYTQSVDLLVEIERYMVEERPYLDNQLSLPELASQLSLSPNWLSQAINEVKKVNFFDFVNAYRVEEAQRLLAQAGEAKVNILDIAMASGFNSKSAFYTAFKKFTGLTPSQFRRSLEQSHGQ